jgi:hypothetical protein
MTQTRWNAAIEKEKKSFVVHLPRWNGDVRVLRQNS